MDGAGGEGGSGSDTIMQLFMDNFKADKKVLVASNMGLKNTEGMKLGKTGQALAGFKPSRLSIGIPMLL